MNRKNIILIIVVVLGLMSALGCSESDDNSETSVESENIQTGESQAMQEEEPEPAITEETVTETPVSDDVEKPDTVSLEEAKEVEEEVPEEEPEVDMETRMKEIEEEAEEEESTPASTVSSDDIVWISVMTDDLDDVQSDMDGVSRAATNNDMASLTTYCDRLYTSTNTAIDHCDKYDVSADLQPVEDEYRLAMVAYNWAAVYCYAGIEAYNAGNNAEFTASFEDATEFIESGTDHASKATDLMNEYNENHGI
jgi:hypothetical protein